MPTIEDEMRSQMGHWETHEPTLKVKFIYLIEKKFNGEPGVAQKLMELANGHIQENPDCDVYSIIFTKYSSDVRELTHLRTLISFIHHDNAISLKFSLVSGNGKEYASFSDSLSGITAMKLIAGREGKDILVTSSKGRKIYICKDKIISTEE